MKNKKLEVYTSHDVFHDPEMLKKFTKWDAIMDRMSRAYAALFDRKIRNLLYVHEHIEYDRAINMQDLKNTGVTLVVDGGKWWLEKRGIMLGEPFSISVENLSPGKAFIRMRNEKRCLE